MTYEEYLSFGELVNTRGERRFEDCPSCGDDKGHFYFNEKLEVGHCKKCDYSPNRKVLCRDLKLLHVEERKPLLSQIVEQLEDIGDSPEAVIEGLGEEDEPGPVISLPTEAEPAYHYAEAVAYLRKRDVTLKQIFDYNLYYCRKGRYKGRLLFPVHDLEGNLVGFTARGIHSWSSTPKYKTPEGFRISNYLYCADRVDGDDNVVLVEGPFDRISCEGTSVATFGKKLSAGQLQQLFIINPKEITVLWDSDAQTEALKLGALLTRFWPVRVVLLEEGDPGDKTQRELWTLIRRTPLFKSMEWLVQEL